MSILNNNNSEFILSINGEKVNFSSKDYRLPLEVLQLIFEINENKRIISSTTQSLTLEELTKGENIPKNIINSKSKKDNILGINNESHKNKDDDDIAFGVEVGKTTKKEVKQIMDKYVKADNFVNSRELKYEDIGVTFYFSNKDIVNEINIFNQSWSTKKGLKIGDKFERAVELYGQPTMNSPKWSRWRNLSIFIEDGIIRSIRLQK